MRHHHSIDLIPPWKIWGRKLITLKTVCEPLMRGPAAQEQLLASMSDTQKEAAECLDLGKKSVALWRLENLGASWLRQAHSGIPLESSNLPLEICPVAHSGMGVAAVELAGFNPSSVGETIGSFANPEYALFCYESVGAMLALYRPDLFFKTVRCFARLGLVPLVAIAYPNPVSFMAEFPAEIQRLIAHGYGRLLYFKSISIASAIRSAEKLPFLQVSASVQGIAFAYLMVNTTDLERVLPACLHFSNSAYGCAFKTGLIYALVFLEWLFPGTLDSLSPKASYNLQLISAAKREILTNRSNGSLASFRLLENPP